jgi:CO/xanthine dehydrogenase FAD-binding subunit
VAHADPAAELPALLTCLNGEVLAQSIHGERVIKAEEFFTGYLSTALEPGELLTEVRFPLLPSRAGWAFLEFARRSGDYALVGAAAVVTPDADDHCMSGHIAYLGIAGAPIRGHDVESSIVGTTLDDSVLDAAAKSASLLVSEDMGDVHATVEYRRVLTGELTKRVLKAAWEKRSH